jgi:hypothetical protein
LLAIILNIAVVYLTANPSETPKISTAAEGASQKTPTPPSRSALNVLSSRAPVKDDKGVEKEKIIKTKIRNNKVFKLIFTLLSSLKVYGVVRMICQKVRERKKLSPMLSGKALR